MATATAALAPAPPPAPTLTAAEISLASMSAVLSAFTSSVLPSTVELTTLASTTLEVVLRATAPVPAPAKPAPAAAASEKATATPVDSIFCEPVASTLTGPPASSVTPSTVAVVAPPIVFSVSATATLTEMLRPPLAVIPAAALTSVESMSESSVASTVTEPVLSRSAPFLIEASVVEVMVFTASAPVPAPDSANPPETPSEKLTAADVASMLPSDRALTSTSSASRICALSMVARVLLPITFSASVTEIANATAAAVEPLMLAATLTMVESMSEESVACTKTSSSASTTEVFLMLASVLPVMEFVASTTAPAPPTEKPPLSAKLMLIAALAASTMLVRLASTRTSPNWESAPESLIVARAVLEIVFSAVIIENATDTAPLPPADTPIAAAAVSALTEDVSMALTWISLRASTSLPLLMRDSTTLEMELVARVTAPAPPTEMPPLAAMDRPMAAPSASMSLSALACTVTDPVRASIVESAIRARVVPPTALSATVTAPASDMAAEPLADTAKAAETTVESIEESLSASTSTLPPETTPLPSTSACTRLVVEFSALAPAPAPVTEKDPLAPTLIEAATTTASISLSALAVTSTLPPAPTWESAICAVVEPPMSFSASETAMDTAIAAVLEAATLIAAATTLEVMSELSNAPTVIAPVASTSEFWSMTASVSPVIVFSAFAPAPENAPEMLLEAATVIDAAIVLALIVLSDRASMSMAPAVLSTLELRMPAVVSVEMLFVASATAAAPERAKDVETPTLAATEATIASIVFWLMALMVIRPFASTL